MDIMMPEMDGMETMRAMRQLPRGKELPLIAVTASDEGRPREVHRRRCLDYLSKPSTRLPAGGAARLAVQVSDA